MGAARTVQLGGGAVRHKGNTGKGSTNTVRPIGIFRRILDGFFALALVLGAVAAGVIALSVGAAPAGANPPGYVDIQEGCWAISSAGVNEGATSDSSFAGTSSPATVAPGGTFTMSVGDSGDNNVPASSGGYTLSSLYDSYNKFDIPVGATIVSGPTITSPGYYYNPATPSVTTPINYTATLLSDANSPSGQVIDLSETTNIPGGDNYVQATMSVTLQASANPPSNTYALNMLNVPPVGSASNTTDAGDGFITAVTGVPVYGNVTATLTCWPFPNPQPAVVSTPVIDNVPPIVTIAAPGDNSQVVENSHVAANFSCIDPPTYGNGIQSCTATNDGNPITNGQLIDTSTAGPHNVVVTGINNSGYQTQQTSNYTVILPPYDLNPPTVSITTPVNGQQVITGSSINANYSCGDTGGSGLATCTGTVGNGAAIDTSAGYHTFTVTATDNRGNPTTETVGYFARTSNTATNTTSSDVGVGFTQGADPATQYNCSLGDDYLKYGLLSKGKATVCPAFGGSINGHDPVVNWKVTAPAGNGGQLAAGDTLTVDEQVFKPGWTATAANMGYYSGPYSENLTVNAPAGTTINGPITSSSTGLSTSTYGQGSALNGAACNYSFNYTQATSATCANTGTSASGSTTIGGSTTVGTYAAPTVGTMAATTIASASNLINVTAFTGSATLHVAAVTNFPTATGNRLYVATSAGTATLSYTSTSTSTTTCGSSQQPCFTGVNLVGGSGTLSTGGAVNRANALGDMNSILPISATTNLPTAGRVYVATSAGTDTLAYTATSTTAGTCGTTSGCLTGVSIITGTGTDTVSQGGAVNRANNLNDIGGILPIASVNGLRTSGSVNVPTSGGPAVLSYTNTSTTAGTCGTSACLTGVTVTSGSGTVSAGAVTQVNPDVSTFTGSGVLELASTSGFSAPGSVTVATSNGTAHLTFTGTSTTAATCGASGTVACLTGVSDASGSGVASPGGTVSQTVLQNVSDVAAYSSLAAGATGIDVTTLNGTQSLPALSLPTACPGTGATGVTNCFATSGTLILQTSTGNATVSYTGVSGTSFTGVSYVSGSGTLTGGNQIWQQSQWGIKGATTVNGVSVSGYNWSVPASNESSFSVGWNGSSCQDSTGNPGGVTSGTGGDVCGTNNQEQGGIDGVYIYVQYELVVTSPGSITIPGLGVIGAVANNPCNGTPLLSGNCLSSATFSTNATSAPGISFTSVDASPPTATLSTPSQGALYAFGQTVNANYSCAESTGGVTISSCTGVEDAGTTYQQTVANGSPLNTSDLVPKQIHTFTVTATNSEGYVSTSNATFITLANPPVLNNQSPTVQSGGSVTVPFNYSGTYPADLTTESIVSPPSHGTATINGDGSITYQNNNSANATDSFQFSVNDTAGNPANVETVSINVQDQVDPTITVTTPPPDNSGSYPYQSVVDAAYSSADNVQVASCTASQTVNDVVTPVANGDPIDTSSLIVGDTHSLTVTAVDWAGNTTTQTVTYKVVTPGPVANNDTASTINPNEVTIPVLNNDTSIFPLDPTTVSIVSPPTYGTAVPQLSGVVRYTPTSASTTSITTDTFTYTVTDTDGQVSAPATATVTIYPVPAISGISPTAGPLGSGTSVVVTGTGFNTASAVSFGGQPAVSFHVDSNTQITAVAPAAPGGVPGTQDITVTTSGGSSQAVTADTYTWDPVPTVTGVSPGQGIAGGGATITVTGTGFTQSRAGATTVSVGGVQATNVVVSSDTQLTATVPAASAAGTVDVIATTPGGTSATSPADHFTYFFSVPAVSSVSPTAGPAAGGTTVTISGSNFTGATAVTFGSTPAASFTVNSNGSITAVSPAGTAGTRVDITVTGPGGTSTTLSADQFTYGPQVTSVAPATGPTNGGTTVNITGSGFTGATTVSFGNTPALSFTVNSATSITATSPSGSPGTVDVTVTTPSATSATSAADHFTFQAPAPSVSSVSPSSGPVAGGQTVTITGNYVTGATAVKFGGVNAASFSVTSSSTITATTPAGTAGTVDVTVTTPGGTSALNSGDHYTFGPAITGVSPPTGSTSGGTSVTITGTDLTGATAVSFGGTAALSYTVNSSTSITAVSPPESAGTVNIQVTTPDGTSPTVSADSYTYQASAPTVTAVSPSNGGAAGGTSVSITGSGFSGATGVSFGSTAATSFSVTSSSTITAVAPAGTAGSTVDIRVTGPGGTSGVVSADHFTYGGVITHLSVSSGSTVGGSSVVITGTGFTGATGVTFGGTAATSYTVNSSTSITAVSPAHAAGTVDIQVNTTGGLTPITSADQFTYTATKPVISSLTPSVGTPAGGDTVTITGTGFTGATTVSFGSTPATSFTVNSNTSITATSPAGTATSTVDITVTGPGGTSNTTTADHFTYGPVITSVSPNSGSHNGGTTVTIKGAGFTGATSVQFGSTSVTSGITVNATGTQITVKAPAGAAGTVDVTVTAGGFTSLASASQTFTYV